MPSGSGRIPAFALSLEWNLARMERTKSHDQSQFESGANRVSA